MPILGCTGDGEGADCATRAPAAELVAFHGEEPAWGEVDATAGDGSLSFSLDAGFDQAMHADGAKLVVGTPAQDAVFTYSIESFTQGLPSLSMLTGPLSLERFGAAVVRLGEVTVVGAPDASPDPDRAEAGAVYLYRDLQEPEARIDGTDAEDHLGGSLAGCGDVDGDGVADWVAAATWADSLAGAVTLGSVDAQDGDAEALVTLTPPTTTSAATGAQFGRALACADVRGDALDEVIVGAPYAASAGFGTGAGAVYLYSAPTTGAAPSATLVAPSEDAAFGTAVAAADFDADGDLDLAVGAPGANAGAGAVYLYFAGRAMLEEWNPDRELRSAHDPSGFGSTLDAADVDGDGVEELLVGAPRVEAEGSLESGAVFVFDGEVFADGGTAEDFTAVSFSDRAATSFVASESCRRVGARLAAPDLDEDGLDDLVLLERVVGD